jgi:hypothetical protein
MNNSRSLVVVVTAGLVGAFAIADVASAQKMMTYEQAFKACKAELDQQGVFGTTVSATARATAGGACMQRHGYRLKKKSKL